MNGDPDPEKYVQENSDQLVFIIKHSNNRFVRALCLASLIKYGDKEVTIDQIERELEQLKQGEIL